MSETKKELLAKGINEALQSMRDPPEKYSESKEVESSRVVM